MKNTLKQTLLSLSAFALLGLASVAQAAPPVSGDVNACYLDFIDTGIAALDAGGDRQRSWATKARNATKGNSESIQAVLEDIFDDSDQIAERCAALDASSPMVVVVCPAGGYCHMVPTAQP